MTAIYGHRWSGNHGLVDEDDTWALALSGMTARDLARGLSQCIRIGASRSVTGDDDWPPTAGEFRQLCMRDAHPERALYLAPAAITTISEIEKRRIVNDLCRSAGLPSKYLDRDPGDDDE